MLTLWKAFYVVATVAASSTTDEDFRDGVNAQYNCGILR